MQVFVVFQANPTLVLSNHNEDPRIKTNLTPRILLLVQYQTKLSTTLASATFSAKSGISLSASHLQSICIVDILRDG
jgi:hypothetical protein